MIRRLVSIKFFILIFFITINSHSTNTHNLSEILENLFLDAVEKNISFSQDIPKEFEKYLLYWFENKIKLNER